MSTTPPLAPAAPSAAATFPALDPAKAEKLNERFNRAPGASASVGFDDSSSSLHSAPRSMTAVWNEGEGKSPSTPGAAPAPSTPSATATSRGAMGEEEEDAGDAKRQRPDVEDDSDEFSLGKLNKKKRAGNRFSQEEDDMLLAKQSELGSNWKLIVQQSSGDLASRTPGSISKRFAHLQSKRPVATTTTTTTTTTSATKPSSMFSKPIDEDEVQIVDSVLSTAPAVKPVAAAAAATFTPNTSLETFGFTSSRPHPQLKEELDRMRLELEKASRERQLLEEELAQRGREFEVLSRDSKQRKERSCEVFQSILRHQDEQEALKSRKAALENSLLFGRYALLRTGISHPKEVFEDGSVKRELDAKRNQLLITKLELEKKRPSKRQQQQQPSLEAVMEERAMDELRQSKQSKYKRETEELTGRIDQYRSDKMLHQRELRRIQHEDASKFSTRPVLKNRYLLRQLLGKGGFSEVWKAFDFELMRDVAVKIHDLDPAWTEERKANYLKHAKREYEIHAAIRHPRIAQLYGLIDHIEGSNSSFATVMEFCPSLDLDCVLKRQQRLGEKEAKCILIQILSGLLHLSNGAGIKNSLGIIHFDIKPANILFDGDGSVKITDFGLSKIVTDDNMETFDGGIELTSQGAGTYWYLPPECFHFDRKNPPNISSKVDVFSAGVVFYQMLYGIRPFGEGKTQEGMLKEGTMTGALRVQFPDKPVVSEAAKDFINRCLTHSQDLRPDMASICADPYLKSKPGKAGE